MPIPMVSHSELVITVLPGDENTAIKNYLEENMTVSKACVLNDRNKFRSLCRLLFAVRHLSIIRLSVSSPRKMKIQSLFNHSDAGEMLGEV